MEIRNFTALIYKEEDKYIARCKELLIVGTGSSVDEAVNDLKHLIESYSKEYKLRELKKYPKSLGENAEEITFSATIGDGKDE